VLREFSSAGAQKFFLYPGLQIFIEKLFSIFIEKLLSPDGPPLGRRKTPEMSQPPSRPGEDWVRCRSGKKGSPATTVLFNCIGIAEVANEMSGILTRPFERKTNEKELAPFAIELWGTIGIYSWRFFGASGSEYFGFGCRSFIQEVCRRNRRLVSTG